MEKMSKGASSNSDSKEEIAAFQFRLDDNLKYVSNKKEKIVSK